MNTVEIEHRSVQFGEVYFNTSLHKWIRRSLSNPTREKFWVIVGKPPPDASRCENLTFFEAVAILKRKGGKIYHKSSPPGSFIPISASGNNLLLRDKDSVIVSCDNLAGDGWIWEPRE